MNMGKMVEDINVDYSNSKEYSKFLRRSLSEGILFIETILQHNDTSTVQDQGLTFTTPNYVSNNEYDNDFEIVVPLLTNLITKNYYQVLSVPATR